MDSMDPNVIAHFPALPKFLGLIGGSPVRMLFASTAVALISGLSPAWSMRGGGQQAGAGDRTL